MGFGTPRWSISYTEQLNVIFPQARMSPVANLGFGVLDTAMVETMAFVLEEG